MGASSEIEPVGTLRSIHVGRWTRLAATCTIGIALAVVATAWVAAAPAGHRIPVTVHSGETLLDIARSVQPDADPDLVVQQIQEANGLSGPDVRPGVVVEVPVAGGG